MPMYKIPTDFERLQLKMDTTPKPGVSPVTSAARMAAVGGFPAAIGTTSLLSERVTGVAKNIASRPAIKLPNS